MSSRLSIGAVLLALVLPALPVQGQSDLDAFMQAVLARRDENWKKLREFVLDEREAVEFRGPSAVPLWGERREYRWYIEDGFFVRSPTKVNGVTVPDDDRRKYEAGFLKQAKAREKRDQEREAKRLAGEGGGEPADPPPATDLEGLIGQTRRPQFVDSAYFLKFKFEQGKYALVSRERLDATEVLKVEYYPERLFTHEQEAERKRRDARKVDRGEDVEAKLEQMMNKVSLVTLWIEPTSKQIVKYTFDNVNFDFLPAAWFLRVDDLRASMTMSQAFPDVWLPRDLEFSFAAMLAIGRFDMRYRINYYDYREAKTSGRIRSSGGQHESSR